MFFKVTMIIGGKPKGLIYFQDIWMIVKRGYRIRSFRIFKVIIWIYILCSNLGFLNKDMILSFGF